MKDFRISANQSHIGVRAANRSLVPHVEENGTSHVKVF
jgi:hypothetical protein